MIKRITKETISEYDQDGKLVRQTTTETTEDDDTPYYPYYPLRYTAPETPAPWWAGGPTVTCSCAESETKSE